MECCRVYDALPECTVTGFSPGLVDPNVNWLHIRVDPLSQMERGRPQGLLQWLGNQSDASITRWWSYWKSARATCPNPNPQPLNLQTLSHICGPYPFSKFYDNPSITATNKSTNKQTEKHGWKHYPLPPTCGGGNKVMDTGALYKRQGPITIQLIPELYSRGH